VAWIGFGIGGGTIPAPPLPDAVRVAQEDLVGEAAGERLDQHFHRLVAVRGSLARQVRIVRSVPGSTTTAGFLLLGGTTTPETWPLRMSRAFSPSNGTEPVTIS